MRRHVQVAALACGLAAVAWLGGAGCGGGGGGGGPGPLPLSEFHDAELSAECRLLVLCGHVPDEATCRATQYEEPHLYASLPKLVAAGRIDYDAQKARACVDELNTLPSCNRSVESAPGALAACRQVLAGRVAVGGDCFFNDECVDRGTCQRVAACDSSQCCPGTCLANPPTLPAGADCSDFTLSCETGTVCTSLPDQDALLCQPVISTVGASCMSISCADSLTCDPATFTCPRRAHEGGTCEPARGDADCDDPRDRCDSSGVCLRLPAVGASCASEGTCVAWAACDPTLRTCVELPSVGQPCLAAAGPRCLGGAHCDTATNTCVVTPAGSSCL